MTKSLAQIIEENKLLTASVDRALVFLEDVRSADHKKAFAILSYALESVKATGGK